MHRALAKRFLSYNFCSVILVISIKLCSANLIILRNDFVFSFRNYWPRWFIPSWTFVEERLWSAWNSSKSQPTKHSPYWASVCWSCHTPRRKHEIALWGPYRQQLPCEDNKWSEFSVCLSFLKSTIIWINSIKKGIQSNYDMLWLKK